MAAQVGLKSIREPTGHSTGHRRRRPSVIVTTIVAWLRRARPLLFLTVLMSLMVPAPASAAAGQIDHDSSARSAWSGAKGSDAGARPHGLRGHLLFTRAAAGDVQAIFEFSHRSERQVTPPGAYCCLLRVSPDRRRILVMPGGDIPLPVTGGTINRNGGDFRRLPLTDPTLNLVPQAWSPNGRRIAFEGWDFDDLTRTGVYTARASDGGDLRRVTTRPGESHDIPLDFSPDGRRLVFYRTAVVNPDSATGGALWTIGVDGSNPVEIAGTSVGPSWWARWSRDGRRILFGNQRTAPSGALWTVAPDGSALRTLFVDRAGRFPIEPTWSPDGSQILFGLDPTNDQFAQPPNGLYVINANGSQAASGHRHPRFQESTRMAALAAGGDQPTEWRTR